MSSRPSTAYGFDEGVLLTGKSGVMLIAEGERDARALLDLRWPAISRPHGAALDMAPKGQKKWRPEYTERLKAAGVTRRFI